MNKFLRLLSIHLRHSFDFEYRRQWRLTGAPFPYVEIYKNETSKLYYKFIVVRNIRFPVHVLRLIWLIPAMIQFHNNSILDCTTCACAYNSSIPTFTFSRTYYDYNNCPSFISYFILLNCNFLKQYIIFAGFLWILSIDTYIVIYVAIKFNIATWYDAKHVNELTKWYFVLFFFCYCKHTHLRDSNYKFKYRNINVRKEKSSEKR